MFVLSHKNKIYPLLLWVFLMLHLWQVKTHIQKQLLNYELCGFKMFDVYNGRKLFFFEKSEMKWFYYELYECAIFRKTQKSRFIAEKDQRMKDRLGRLLRVISFSVLTASAADASLQGDPSHQGWHQLSQINLSSKAQSYLQACPQNDIRCTIKQSFMFIHHKVCISIFFIREKWTAFVCDLYSWTRRKYLFGRFFNVKKFLMIKNFPWLFLHP